MKILITDNGYITESKDMPEVGKHYTLEDAITGTAAQNRAFHSLLVAFWKWMFRVNRFQFTDGNVLYDLSTPDAEAFKDYFKYKYGQGFSHIQYVNNDNGMIKVDNMSEVPDYAVKDFNNGNLKRVKGVLKSWTKYTKKQRRDCIDTLKMIIGLSGCDDEKVHEILEGMENEQA